MENKINENHSLTNLLNKQTKKIFSSNIQLDRSRELFAMYMNDCFLLSSEDDHYLEDLGIQSKQNYQFLYSKNISLILRRYIYNVLCKDGIYYGKNKTIPLHLLEQPSISSLPYSRTSNQFLESCLKVLKERMSDLGFYDESINKTLKKYLYGQATPIGSNLKTKISFYLGFTIDELNYILDCLEITKNPTSYKEEIALDFISRLSKEDDPNYFNAYQEYKDVILSMSAPKKQYFSNNHHFIQLVDEIFNHSSIDDLLSFHEIELDRVVKKKKQEDDYDYIDDKWSKYLIDFRNDLLDDSTYKNIKKMNIPVKKRHVELLFFYDCLIHHEEYFEMGTYREIKKHFETPANKILCEYGLSLIDYHSAFDKFLILCLLKYKPAQLFNKIVINANYIERSKYE